MKQINGLFIYLPLSEFAQLEWSRNDVELRNRKRVIIAISIHSIHENFVSYTHKCHKHFYINGIIYLQMYAKTIRYIYPFQNYSYILCDCYSLYTKCVKCRNWFSIPSKLCTNSMGSGLSERKFQFPIALMFTYFHLDYERYKFKAFWYNVFIIRIYSYRFNK